MRISGLLIGILLITGSVFGQLPEIRLGKPGIVDQPVAGVSVVVNPKNAGNIVAALATDIYVTSDSGRTWSKIKMNSPHGVNGQPQLMADRKGILYYIHQSGHFINGVPDISSSDRIVIQKSKDEGLTWEEEDVVGFNDSTKISYMRAVYDSKSKNITAIWTKLESYPPVLVSDQSNIQVSWSSGGGKNWEDPVTVNKEFGDCQDSGNTLRGDITLGSNGQLFAVWTHGNRIMLDRSYDKGKMWLRNDLEVAREINWLCSVPGIKEGYTQPSLAADRSQGRFKGMFFMTWSDQRNGEGDSDIWMVRSGSGGDTWTSAQRLNDDEAGKQQYDPAITVDQATGILYVAYFDRRNSEDNHTDIYLAYSVDGGARFKNVRITRDSFLPVKGVSANKNVSVSAYNGTICTVWTSVEEGEPAIRAAVFNQTDINKLSVKGP